MASTILIKAAGLETSPNQLERSDGALIEASNVIIKRQGIIEQRRGFNLYGSPFPSINDRTKALTTYRSRIIRHYASKLAFDSDGSGAFQDFDGVIQETQAGLRMKFIESNGNFYFTTSDGIKKISARSADDFTTDSGFIRDAGAVKAVDLTGKVIYTPNSQSAWLPQDSAVAYRVVWAYKDLNNILVQGAPSQRLVISNPMLDLLLQDYMRLLDVLDSLTNIPLTTSRINDKNYISTLGVNLTSSSSNLYSSLIALTTKLDNDIFYADQAAAAPLQMGGGAAVISSGVCTITFASGNPSLYFIPGSKILLSGFSPAVGVLDGAQVVTATTPTTLTFNTVATGVVTLTSATIVSNTYRGITQPSIPSAPATNEELVELQTYIEDIILELSEEPIAVITAADQVNISDLDVTTTVTTQLTITIPEGIDSSYFFQVYRSSIASATGAATFDDVSPSDELQLVYEAYPTEVELGSGFITIIDITPDAFRGANLYTNASTGEGILQSNDAPPFAKDINRYRNSVFYANTRTKERLDLSLLGVTQMISDFNLGDVPTITISNGTTTNTYHFVLGAQQEVDITTVADVANSLNGTYFLISSTDTDYYVWFDTTGAGIDPLIAGRTGIKVRITTGASAVDVATGVFNELSVVIGDFVTSRLSNVVTVLNLEVGQALSTPTVGTSGFAVAVTITGIGEKVLPQITNITTIAGNLYTAVGSADYFIINTTLDRIKYYPWFKVGISTDPLIAGAIGIEIALTGAETAPQVAALISAALPTTQFETSVNSNVVTVTNVQYGMTSNATESVANAGFLTTTKQNGALDILLSPQVSPARAADETARSFVRVINKNPGESIYAYYLSSVFDVPGKMLFEARSLGDAKFYVIGNNDNTGLSFNPDIGPTNIITAISAAAASIITTSTAHGLLSEQQVMITASDSVPKVDGLFTVTVLSPTTFSIPQFVSTPGTEGSIIAATAAVFSENEEKINRVYFSKFQQPEAVPISNYFDVGAADKSILRIIPLRDSLFVFKEDGLYRISGESAPFQLELFDNSFITLAPDSGAVSNNTIFCWTTQGIQSLSESGSNNISRGIDNIILRIQSSNFPDFKTATWGVGYESDNSYLVFTVTEEGDEEATIGYRYSTLTDTWTTYDMAKTCGVVNSNDDKLYLGANDVPYIEQERKTFSRLDYTDRELDSVISVNKLIGNKILLPSVTGISVGDVVVQDQTITATEFNIILNKLDMDTGVSDSNYFSLLALSAGLNPRAQLVSLANKLDTDSGVAFTTFFSTIDTQSGVITATTVANPTIITSVGHGLLTGRVILIDSSTTTPSINGEHVVTVINANTFSIPVRVTTAGAGGNFQTVDSDFQDLKTCYNAMMVLLNSDTGVSFTNYKSINNNTIQESIITAINTITKQITLNLSLPYLVGDITVFEAFESTFTYSPITMGDPLMLKHLREATLMFETRTITGGVLSFATDLLPEFQDVPFNLDGNGIFGHTSFGTGFFGGLSNSAPFRTYIPRQCQRCRYMVVKFTHKTAREDYRVNGITLTGEVGQSTRAYR
jgi:hypothetical protein